MSGPTNYDSQGLEMFTEQRPAIVQLADLMDYINEMRDLYNETQQALQEAQSYHYFTSVKEFGAKGDGISDETSFIQSAYDSLNNGGVLFFPNGVYKIDGKINVDPSKGVSFVGDGFGASIIKCNNGFLTTENSPLITSTSVVGNIVEKSYEVNVNSSVNMKVGQLIVFQSTELLPETAFLNPKTHTAKITTISGNKITIDRPFPTNFNGDNYVISVRCYYTKPMKIEGLTLLSNYNGFVVDLKYCEQVYVSVEINNSQESYQGKLTPTGEIFGVRLWYSLDIVINNSKFNYLTYGVLPTFGCVNATVSNSTAIKTRHIVAPTGGSQNFKALNLTCYSCYAGIDSHQTAFDSTFENCKSYGNEIADKLRGRQDTIINCYSSNGLEMRNDSALMTANKKDLMKTIINSIVDGDCIFPSTVNVSINGLTINNGKLESFTSPAGETFFANNIKISKTSGVAVWIPFHKQVSFRNCRINGVYQGIPQLNGNESITPNVAFLLDRAIPEKMVFENVTIDGFDVAMSMPNTLDCKRYKIVMVDFINSVTAFKAGTTDKYFLTLDGSSFTGTKTKFDNIAKFINLNNIEKF